MLRLISAFMQNNFAATPVFPLDRPPFGPLPPLPMPTWTTATDPNWSPAPYDDPDRWNPDYEG